MSSSLVNFASRVLSVDQESTSFVPIIGINKAADLSIIDAMMLAWRDCANLHSAIDEDDIEVCAALIARALSASCHVLRRPSPQALGCTS
jgi:hypothetical protein